MQIQGLFTPLFLEPHLFKSTERKAPAGWIEVVCGSMFSGKTEELIRRLKRAKIAQMRVESSNRLRIRATTTKISFLTTKIPSALLLC